MQIPPAGRKTDVTNFIISQIKLSLEFISGQHYSECGAALDWYFLLFQGSWSHYVSNIIPAAPTVLLRPLGFGSDIKTLALHGKTQGHPVNPNWIHRTCLDRCTSEPETRTVWWEPSYILHSSGDSLAPHCVWCGQISQAWSCSGVRISFQSV